MKIHRAKASEVCDLAAFYRITYYGGSVAPADRVVYATEEGRIVAAGRLSEEEGVLVLRGMSWRNIVAVVWARRSWTR